MQKEVRDRLEQVVLVFSTLLNHSTTFLSFSLKKQCQIGNEANFYGYKSIIISIILILQRRGGSTMYVHHQVHSEQLAHSLLKPSWEYS